MRSEIIKGKETGKRFLKSIFCLILLTAIMWIVVFSAVKVLQGQEDFDNPIDAEYVPQLYSGSEEKRIALLIEYEEAWKNQLEAYLTDYRLKCNYQKDREMVDEYLEAVYKAVDAQKNLMEYMNVPKEEQLWYSARIYYCAYVKSIRGGFDNCETDYYYAADMSMYAGSEGEIRCRQEAFNIEWCNKLALLTMDFYETLDKEGKQLAGIWQESREKWKKAFSNRFWWEPEELNAADEDDSFWGNGTATGIMEVNGWIDKLYYQQLESMMKVP